LPDCFHDTVELSMLQAFAKSFHRIFRTGMRSAPEAAFTKICFIYRFGYFGCTCLQNFVLCGRKSGGTLFSSRLRYETSDCQFCPVSSPFQTTPQICNASCQILSVFSDCHFVNSRSRLFIQLLPAPCQIFRCEFVCQVLKPVFLTQRRFFRCSP